MYTSAIIGAGNWGKKLINELTKINALKAIVFTGKPETAEWLRKNCPNIYTTNDFDEILNDKTINNVFIATPIKTHGEITLSCLGAGKNVFVEKPLSSSTDEVTHLHQLAKSNGLRLVTGYVYLFDPALTLLKKQLLDEETIEVNLNWEKYGSFEEPVIENLLVHEIAIAHYLLGKYKSIVTKHLGEDIVHLKLKFERGIANIKINRTMPEKKKWADVSSNSGSFRLEFGVLTHNGIQIMNERQDLLPLEIHSFFENIDTFEWQEIDTTVANVLSDLKD